MSKKISEHFYEYEVECSCGCGTIIIDYELLYMLEVARTKSGIPFSITSWIRCEEYNQRIGGVTGSAHVKGKAVDIAFNDDHEKYTIIAYLMWAGFKRIGVSDKENFIHVDIDNEKPTPAVWVY